MSEPTPTPPQAGGRKPQEQDAQAVIDAALAVDWGSLQYDGLEPVKAFIDLLSLYVTKWGKTSGTGGGGQPPTHSPTYQDACAEALTYMAGRGFCTPAEGYAGVTHALSSAIYEGYKMGKAAAADPARRQQTPPAAAPAPPTIVSAPTAEQLKPDEAERAHIEALQAWERESRHSQFRTGDAPPRPPQARQPPDRDQLVAAYNQGFLAGQKYFPVPAAPTPAPTLTAPEQQQLDTAIGLLASRGWPHDALCRLRDRLLAAGAPTAASTALTEAQCQPEARTK